MITNINFELLQLKHTTRNDRFYSINTMFKDIEHYISYTKFKNSIKQMNLNLNDQEVEDLAFKNFIRYSTF